MIQLFEENKVVSKATLISYLTFNGNCRKAMLFYQKCLGGNLYFQTVGESPLSEKMPSKMKKCIVHSTLKNDNLVLMASDMVSDERLIRGNAISLMLNFNNEKNLRECFKKLSSGGNKTHKIENTFWGALSGNLTDKFGNNWLLHFDKQNH